MKSVEKKIFVVFLRCYHFNTSTIFESTALSFVFSISYLQLVSKILLELIFKFGTIFTKTLFFDKENCFSIKLILSES